MTKAVLVASSVSTKGGLCACKRCVGDTPMIPPGGPVYKFSPGCHSECLEAGPVSTINGPGLWVCNRCRARLEHPTAPPWGRPAEEGRCDRCHDLDIVLFQVAELNRPKWWCVGCVTAYLNG